MGDMGHFTFCSLTLVWWTDIGFAGNAIYLQISKPLAVILVNFFLIIYED